MTNKVQKAVRPPKEVKKGAVQPDKPTKLPNVAQPVPVSTTTNSPSSSTKPGTRPEQ